MSAPVREGDLLAGKYLVERVVGAGGMGVVVAARHIHLDERVALKFLLPEALSDPGLVKRFLREGKAASKIRSEHVARVFDVGSLENGAPYIVMEFLEGSDLAALVKAHGPLPVSVAVEYVLQACEAIAEAHAVGIIHRDIKPSNLFLAARRDGSPVVKVIDFGISKMTAGPDAGMDVTPSYSPPGESQFPGSPAGRPMWWPHVIITMVLKAAG
jgi:serine/threonine-protein kinase